LFLKDNISKDKFTSLAWVVKRGLVLKSEEFEVFLESFEKKLLWTNDKSIAEILKRKWLIKRFKIVDLKKTDLEIKKKWVEILKIKNFYGIVLGYQNIELYETIDFEKPVRSMKIWMMPAKFTHQLLNLATWCENWKTIYDPFCWLWTTLFVANYFGHNAIWSDLNPTPAKQNLKWWQTTKLYNKNYHIKIFKQDITKPFRNKIVYKCSNVVSEWYLGPIINHYLSEKVAENLENQVWQVYFAAIKNLLILPNLENILITFPVYILRNWSKYIFEKTLYKIKNLWINLEVLPEIYFRKGQKVWRMIVLIKKKRQL
jgi:hypothetical protein